MFFVSMAERPEYNDKIQLMSALAPVAYTQHMISPLRQLAPFVNEIEVSLLCDWTKAYLVLRNE